MGVCKVQSTPKLLEITASGALSVDDVCAVVDAWYPQLTATRVLWDLSGADISRLTDQDYVKIALHARAKLPVRQSAKTAYIVADAAAFMKLWRYVERAAAVKVGVEYSAFTERKSAERWLRQP